jgi:hypothetical protein
MNCAEVDRLPGQLPRRHASDDELHPEQPFKSRSACDNTRFRPQRMCVVLRPGVCAVRRPQKPALQEFNHSLIIVSTAGHGA